MIQGRPRAAERGWTILEVLLVLLFLGFLVALAVPNLLSARQRNDEAAAIRSLRELVAVQEMVRTAAVVDEDRDGKGEYAFLEEICGERNPRSFASRDGGSAPVPLPQFRHKLLEDGEAEVCGYRFRLWLPGPGGTAAGGGKGEGAGAPDQALAAKVWCAYAWPLRREGTMPPPTGRRTFFASQAGEVLASDGAYASLPPGENAAPVRPAPGAAFLAPGPLATITGAPAVGTRGRDGNVWTMVE